MAPRAMIQRLIAALPAVAVAAVLSVAAPPPAGADSLSDAKAAGTVGETPRGYIAPVGTATPEIAALVEEINARRRIKYQEIAEKTGSTLEQVEVVVGSRVIEQAPPGTYILDESGQWRRK
ncbi:MAG: YdbL family protein [Alphaproteobacteria bacterium]